MAESSVERSPDRQPESDGLPAQPTSGFDQATAYRVLARKYRPASFADLIGQEALVRTLSNAIASGRLAHAFILTGVRGVGKTTTARIIARALNCVGPDGQGGPTVSPCGVCKHCTAIAQDRDVDVMEMDAASRTGIDDIRSLIEGVNYRPIAARYKIYIIDEVHMLSRQAFNGLLKTLEEPPAKVIFIFATTEIRKVPVTVLSRCQRFDLRRVEQEALVALFARIAEAEGGDASREALAMIARAADGSVRDGLSLLDQALALAAAPGDALEDGGRIAIDAAQVKHMLGLADRTRVFDLFEAVMRGQAPEALAILADMHAAGADPAVVLQDLLELAHFLTRLKLVPAIAKDPALPEAERVRGRSLAERLTLPVLARAWQMLLKGLGETRAAPQPLQAAEMVLIRLAYASDLPTPGDLVARLTAEGGTASAGAPAAAPAAPTSAPTAGLRDNAGDDAAPHDAAPLLDSVAADPLSAPPGSEAVAQGSDGEAPGEEVSQGEAVAPESALPAPMPQSWPAVVDLLRARRESKLANHLAHDLHLVSFQPGRIEVRPGPQAPRKLVGQLGRLLEDWTGQRWLVSVSSEAGESPLHEQQQAEEERRREAVLQNPLVQAVLQAFPGASLTARRDAPTRQGSASGQDGAVDAAAPADDDPDPETAAGPHGEIQGESRR